MGALEKMASSVGVNLADSCAKEEFMGYCQSLIEQFQKNGKKESVAKLAPRNTRATSSSFHSTFIERVRIPDFSESYTDSPKYYRIKNVATGEYLAFAGMDAPLTTVAEPDENTLFYFVNRNILGWGDAASFFNKKS